MALKRLKNLRDDGSDRSAYSRLSSFVSTRSVLEVQGLPVGGYARDRLCTSAVDIAVIAPGALAAALARALLVHVLLGVGPHSAPLYNSPARGTQEQILMRGKPAQQDMRWAQAAYFTGPSLAYQWECRIAQFTVRIKPALAPAKLPRVKSGCAILACDGAEFGFRDGSRPVSTLSAPDLVSARELSNLLGELGYLVV